MKLFEIFETDEDIFKDARFRTDADFRITNRMNDKQYDRLRNHIYDPNRKPLGIGSKAYVDTKDANNWKSVTRTSRTSDGTFIFLEAIYNTPTIQTNPYLPKVKQITKDVNVGYSITERLIPISRSEFGPDNNDTAHSPYIEAILNKMFYLDKLPEHLDNVVNTPENWKHLVLPFLLNVAVANPQANWIKDPQLKQAAEFINSVRSQIPDGSIDIHSENLMMRPAKFGVQLVITDPIFNRI